MRTFLPFLVIGITSGSVYALAGLGLVLTYKTSGVFNFAHGIIATAAAYVFYELHVLHGWPWPVAAVVTVAATAGMFGLLLERLASVLTRARTTMQVAATIGILISVEAVAVLRYGGTTRSMPSFLPTSSIRVFGTNVGYDQLIVVAICCMSVLALTWLLQRTRVGAAMRGVVDDPALLDLTGFDPARTARYAWLIGSGFAALSGVLIAPFFGLNALILTLLVVQAFGAAAIGRFRSLPLTYLGGLAIGVLAELSKKYVGDVHLLQGIPSSLPFIMLLVVLVLTPRSRLTELTALTFSARARESSWRPASRRVAVAVVVALLLVVPHVVGVRRIAYTQTLIVAVLFMSLGLLTRANQVSLCQMGFAAVGAAAMSHLTGAGVPWLVALIVSGLVAVPVGAAVAVPAIRVGGVYLALATFGFGILLQQLAYPTFLMFGLGDSRTVARPHLAGIPLDTDTGYYYVSLACLAAMSLVVITLDRQRLGRLLRGLAGSPAAVSTLGASVNVTKVVVFCLSAFVASVAGGLMAGLYQNASGSTYPSFTSLVLLAVLAMNLAFVRGIVASSAAAAVAFVLIPSYISNADVGLYFQAGFGVAAVLAALAETGTLANARWTKALSRSLIRSTSRLRSSPVRARTATALREREV